jgi:hypothetical protein|uniref:Uncharacterized protein n=1 Tax=Siphoviridae sp. ctoiA13 TaxID=2826462 RepID=A0A8S5QYU8_9CAUD|nr:MAG TPA: hypothetical protein [Siphoviridae sp. ctoiA13]
MGQVLITGVSGGTNPDEITARAGDVIEGKTTIDENGEVVKGTIPISKTNKNHVKTMNDGFAWSDDRGLMYVIRTDDNYYIPPVSEGGYNYVGVAEPDLKPENIITGKTIGRVKGSIPVKGGTSHNTNGTRGGYDPPSQRFYCDIERGAYINNCWSGYPEIGIHRDVFIQNLGIRPELLRQGYSLFGVQGTLPDILAGGVVFRDATFYGPLKGGLASSNPADFRIAYYNPYDKRYVDKRITPSLSSSPLELKHTIRSSEVWEVMEDQSFIYIFKNSLNIRYINEIHIEAQMLNVGGVYTDPIIEVGLMSTNMRASSAYSKAQHNYYESTAYHILTYRDVGTYYNNVNLDTKNIVLDIRNINEHAFLYVKMSYSIYRGNPPDTSNIHMKVNRISIS